MADDRRIIYSSYVVPKEGEKSEETHGEKWILSPQDNSGNTINKTMGGKGTIVTGATGIDVSSGENHSSMAHENQRWEDWNLTWDNNAALSEFWDGTVSIDTTEYQLINDGSTLGFCYIKNLGNTELLVSIDNKSTYNIEIPAGGSVHFRGGDDALKNSHIWTKTASGSTSIEYLISSKGS